LLFGLYATYLAILARIQPDRPVSSAFPIRLAHVAKRPEQTSYDNNDVYYGLAMEKGPKENKDGRMREPENYSAARIL
jgi:hypothetical protein